jgi:hypothetical protein
MAGTAKDFKVSEIHQGPGDLWVIGTPPDDTEQRLTLAADGTPDAIAHPMSIHLGAIASAITVSIQPKIEPIKLDQYDAAVDVFVSELDAKIEAEMAQSETQKLQRALGVATYSTAAGYKQITFGGTSVVPTFCVAAISPKRTDATKYIVGMLYRVSATGGIQITISRTKTSFYKVAFTGLCDLERAAGRQIGIVYETI